MSLASWKGGREEARWPRAWGLGLSQMSPVPSLCFPLVPSSWPSLLPTFSHFSLLLPPQFLALKASIPAWGLSLTSYYDHLWLTVPSSDGVWSEQPPWHHMHLAKASSSQGSLTAQPLVPGATLSFSSFPGSWQANGSMVSDHPAGYLGLVQFWRYRPFFLSVTPFFIFKNLLK